MDVDPTKVQTFPSAAAFDAWLARNHSQSSEVWVMMFRKGSGTASISWSEAVVEALAWGWIDGIKKSHDETSWLQRFTPRQAKSGWSKINCAHAEKLIMDEKMREPGLRAVLAAKADGRWDAAYAGGAAMQFPEAFLSLLAENAAAKSAFDKLSRGRLYPIYHRIQTARREETRQRIMTEFVQMLADTERPGS